MGLNGHDLPQELTDIVKQYLFQAYLKDNSLQAQVYKKGKVDKDGFKWPM